MFEPLDYSKDKAQFRFEASNGFENKKFLFDVNLILDYYNKILSTNPDNVTALIGKGYELSSLDNLRCHTIF